MKPTPNTIREDLPERDLRFLPTLVPSGPALDTSLELFAQIEEHLGTESEISRADLEELSTSLKEALKVFERDREIWEEIEKEQFDHLDEVRSLSPHHFELIRHFFNPREWLRLPNLTGLNQGAARHLGYWTGQELDLRGLKYISDSALRLLCRSMVGKLDLDGLESLTEDSANAIFAQRRRKLFLNGITHITPAIAQIIGASDIQSLDMWRLEVTDPESLIHLGRFAGELQIPSTLQEAISEINQSNSSL